MIIKRDDWYTRLKKREARRAKRNLELEWTWKPWFAWYPVRLNSETVIWLEWVERRVKFLKTEWSFYDWMDTTDRPEWWRRDGYEYRRQM